MPVDGAVAQLVARALQGQALEDAESLAILTHPKAEELDYVSALMAQARMQLQREAGVAPDIEEVRIKTLHPKSQPAVPEGHFIDCTFGLVGKVLNMTIVFHRQVPKSNLGGSAKPS